MPAAHPLTANETEAQTYLASLGNSPALFALTGLLASFPVVKVFASNAVPLMMARSRANAERQ